MNTNEFRGHQFLSAWDALKAAQPDIPSGDEDLIAHLHFVNEDLLASDEEFQAVWDRVVGEEWERVLALRAKVVAANVSSGQD
jgi:hypothetical protein